MIQYIKKEVMYLKVLLTGFDPFGGETINPALEAVKRVRAPENIELMKLEVPTVFGKSIDVTMDAVRRFLPDVVLCIGQAGGRKEISVERTAVNICDARIPDNDGNQPVDKPVYDDGPTAYFSNLPIKRMVSAIQSAGVPAAVSDTAGTFVCNQLIYAVLYAAEREFPAMRCGFIHIPFLPEQTASKAEPYPSMELKSIVTAIEAALSAVSE